MVCPFNCEEISASTSVLLYEYRLWAPQPTPAPSYLAGSSDDLGVFLEEVREPARKHGIRMMREKFGLGTLRAIQGEGKGWWCEERGGF